MLSFTSNEMDLLKPIVEWLNDHGIPNWTVEKQPLLPNQRLGYFVSSRHFGSVSKFTALVMPYLVGKKRHQAELMLEFINKFRRKTGGSTGNTIESERTRLLEVCSYREAIRELGGLKGRVKYTKDYLKELWGMNNG